MKKNENKVLPADTVEERIKKNFNSLSKGEKKLATYILDNYRQAILLSSSELARAVGVGDTLVIRMAKDLGYSGFIEFKKAMRANLNISNSPYDFLKKMDSEPDNVEASKYVSTLMSDISTFIQTLDYDILNETVDRILKAKTIYLVGLGSDAVIIRYLFVYFQKMGLNVVGLTEGGCTLWDGLLGITKEDLIIMSSFPRFLKDESQVGEMAKKKSIPLITITDTDVTGILLGSNINFTMKESQKFFFNSIVLPQIFCNLLLLQIYKKRPEQIDSSLKHYAEFAAFNTWA